MVSAYIGQSNCDLDDNPLMNIGLSSKNCGSSHAWGIAFRSDPGGILIRVAITFQYKTESTTSPFPVFATSLTVEWRGVFASCSAAVGQSLSYYATTQVDCQMGATGDLCGLAGATIGLG